MPDRLWIGQTHETEQEVHAAVEKLWADSATHPGTGGEYLVIEEDDPDLVTPTPAGYARLQKFASAVSSEVRFTCVEVFLSARSRGSWRQSRAHMVAAAYRKSDAAYGETKGRDGKSRQRRGVYGLPHQPLASLRHLLVHGEPYAAVRDRIEAFKNHSVERDHTSDYIDYKIAGTIIAFKAKILHEQRRGPGAELWSICSPLVPNGDTANEIKDTNVRCALAYLIEAYNGRLLLEPTDFDAIPQYEAKARQLIERSIRHTQRQDDAVGALPRAAELWRSFTERQHDISHAVRRRADDLSFGTARFLFEARPHTYVPWLQSATLEVDRKGQPVYHRSLDQKIVLGAAQRNKPVDVVAKAAYERAADWLLNGSGLQSMVLAPFTADNGGAIHGFVRLMNRFVGDHLYHYDNEFNQDEASLASALSSVLRRGLSDPTLFDPAAD